MIKILLSGFLVLFLGVLSATAQLVPDIDGVIYVKVGGTGNGSSWLNATGNLQHAINATNVTKVWVAKGTYQLAAGVSFTMKQGVAIYGGFPDDNNSATMADRSWAIHTTVLRGTTTARVVTNIENGLTQDDVLDGFTISGGRSGVGGGIYNEGASPTYRNLIITGNVVTNRGGGIYTASGTPRLINVLISKNQAQHSGGGVYNETSVMLINVTISGNAAGTADDWHQGERSTPVIRNSIIHGTSNYFLQLGDIQNSFVSNLSNVDYTHPSKNNLPVDTNPLFVDAAVNDYRLRAVSPARNKGSNAFFDGLNDDSKDLAGNPRINGLTIDMGAYESNVSGPVPDANGIVYVREGGSGSKTGNSWENAADDFMDAINVAEATQVWVAKGAYQPLSGQTFTPKNGMAIYGGFPDDNNNATMADRNWVTHLTKLQGNGQERVITIINNAQTSTDLLDGFTISGGLANVGGGIYSQGASPSYRNLVITGNIATDRGGGIYLDSGRPRLTNVLISENQAFTAGGVYNQSSAVITNVTVSGNTASNIAGEWYQHLSAPVIRNSIIYGSGIGGFQLNDIRNSLVQGQTSANYSKLENNNLPSDTAPLFTNPSVNDYSLQTQSSAVDRGNYAYFDGLNADTKDLAGNPRLYGEAIDIGAYESQNILPIVPDANGIIHVRQGGSGSKSGNSWENAAENLQKAIDAEDVQQVWVAEGTYQPQLGKSFTMKQGVAIYGGFPDNNNSATMAERNWAAHVTRLHGNGEKRVVSNIGTTENVLTATDILDGFTISGGVVEGAGLGGGIYNEGGSPSYRNLVITANTATNGGGLYAASGAPHLTNVLISKNVASLEGGGVYNNSSAILTNVTISGNTASSGGGDWHQNAGSPVIRNAIIYGSGVIGQLTDVQNSLIQGQTNANYSESGNNNLPTATDPLFTNPRANNYTLQVQSPAVNEGNNDFFNGLNADTRDLGGMPRLDDGIIDMGAYESDGIPPELSTRGVIYVKVGGSGDGSSWSNATGNLQDAINTPNVTRVWVAKGVYESAGLALTMKHGVSIYGGFPDDNNSATMADRNWAIHTTTLRGNGTAGVVSNIENELTQDDVLDGFTISDGNARGGGGIYNEGASPTYSNLVITGNTAMDGGGIYTRSGTPRLINVLITKNVATLGGGGVYNNTSVILTNVTVSGNTDLHGGGEWYQNAGSPVIMNSIIYGNGVIGQLTDVQNSLVKGQTNENYGKSENNNLPGDTDPLFTNPGGNDYSLQAQSSAVDKGNYAFFDGLNANTKDLAGNPRLYDGSIDIGAYERQVSLPIVPDGNGILYVRQRGSGSKSGNSWENAMENLQKAINSAGVTQVWVAKGNYQHSFVMKPGVAIYGGFPDNNNSTTMVDRNWAVHRTTLQGNGATSVVSNIGNELTPDDILDGFTISGGKAIEGGGIYNEGTSPSYVNLVITGNTATNGGGIYVASGTPRLTNVLISKNVASEGGGGVYNETSVKLTNVTISRNTAPSGGEWYQNAGTAVIRNSIIYGSGVNGQLTDVRNSLIQGQTHTGYTNGNNNLPESTDPLFTNPNVNDYTLQLVSPVVNKGSNTFFDGLNGNTKDLKGNPRLFDGVVDMGAYESQVIRPVPDANGIIYVRQGGSGTTKGNSWENAIGNFQDAVNAAGVTQVWVAKGTYQPAFGRSFTMKQGVAIYGGFPDDNNSAAMEDRNWAIHVTRLQGARVRVVTNINNGLTADDILDGFTISGGEADFGGGIYNEGASPTYRNLVITENRGFDRGGGMYTRSGAPSLINVLISKNRADYGGGVFNESSAIVTNVTVSGNTAYVHGGEWHQNSGSPVIRNSIIYGSGVYGLQFNDVRNSLVQGQTQAAYTDIPNNNLPVGTDPLFTDPGVNDYTLQAQSPVVNRGSNSFFGGLNSETKDLKGAPRLYNGSIDMGAYESQISVVAPDANGIIYVRQDGAGSKSGNSWENALGDLQEAIGAPGVNQVWVGKGTYRPESGQAFVMKHGVAIYGGFPNDDNNAARSARINTIDMNDRNWLTNVTTLQGNGNSVIRNEGNGLTNTDILDGFTISGGVVNNDEDNGVMGLGGGIYNYNTSPSYLNLVITGNSAFYAGGIYIDSGSPQLTNLLISQNSAAYGGGMYIYSGSPRLKNVLISKNEAYAGGGMYSSESPVVLTNVTISGNTASIGGEWYQYGGTPVIRNSIIYANGVEGQFTDVRNSLVQDQANAAYEEDDKANLETGTNPLFTDPDANDYTLQRTSPAINKGNNADFDNLQAATKDLNGNPRLVGTTIDMGAYESSEGALPVRWISFEGQLNEQHRAVLTWKAEEINVSHYEVERSANARDFHVAGTISAVGTGLTNYNFTDPASVTGRVVYYRIRQRDLDGTFGYSRIISVSAGGRSEPFAYPNPARDRIAVELGPEYVGSKVRLLNPVGVILQYTEVKENTIRLDISRYPSGVYLLQLQDGKIVKLIKE